MGVAPIHFRRSPVPPGVGIRLRRSEVYGATYSALFALGCTFAWLLPLVYSLYTAWDASHWIATDCTILQAKVQQSIPKGDRTTYSLEIRYTYQFQDHPYTSNRYALKVTKAGNYHDLYRIAHQLPPGIQATCFVNPKDPGSAVLDRSGPPDLILNSALIGLLATISFVTVQHAIRMHRIFRAQSPSSRSPSSAVMSDSQHPPIIAAPATVYLPPFRLGPVTLSPKSHDDGLAYRVILLMVFICFWMIIWPRTTTDKWIPLAIVGLLQVAMLLGIQLSAMRTRIKVSLAQGALHPGGTLQLHWSIPKGAHRIPRLTITLQGTQPSSANGSPNRCVFANIPIVDTLNPEEIRSGHATVGLPSIMMHSLNIRNCRIAWTLHVQSPQPRFGRVREEFPVTVLPAKWPGHSSTAADSE